MNGGFRIRPNGQFVVNSGSGEHTFHFNQLLSAAGISEEADCSLLIVCGKIYNDDSTPRPALIINAFDCNVGADDTLVSHTTQDASSQSSITCTQTINHCEEGT